MGQHNMRKFHSIAALCGDGLRPELQALFERLAVDPHSELFVRPDGMIQAGPDPISETARALVSRLEQEPHLNPGTGTTEFSLRDPDGYYVTIRALDPA